MLSEDTAVTGDDGHRVEGGHLLECLGPFEDVALDPERRPGVRQGRHDEVSADDHPGIGDPHPGVVVRLSEAVTTVEDLVAEPVEHESFLVGDRRRAVDRVADHVASMAVPDGELRVERPGQMPGGLGVALEPLGHVDVPDDVRGIMTACFGILEK